LAKENRISQLENEAETKSKEQDKVLVLKDKVNAHLTSHNENLKQKLKQLEFPKNEDRSDTATKDEFMKNLRDEKEELEKTNIEYARKIEKLEQEAQTLHYQLTMKTIALEELEKKNISQEEKYLSYSQQELQSSGLEQQTQQMSYYGQKRKTEEDIHAYNDDQLESGLVESKFTVIHQPNGRPNLDSIPMVDSINRSSFEN